MNQSWFTKPTIETDQEKNSFGGKIDRNQAALDCKTDACTYLLNMLFTTHPLTPSLISLLPFSTPTLPCSLSVLKLLTA